MSRAEPKSPKSRPPMVSSWTPDREEMARRLYLDEDLSASEVARALGGGLSRGAVIGKISRMGFSKRQVGALVCDRARIQRDRPDLRVVSGPRARSAKRMGPSWPPQPLPPLREAPLQAIPATLFNLVDGACRWPVDDPGPSEMHAALFCAAPATSGRYCAAHLALAAGAPRTSAEAPRPERRRTA